MPVPIRSSAIKQTKVLLALKLSPYFGTFAKSVRVQERAEATERMRFSERSQQLFWHRTRASVGAKAKTVEQNIPTVERAESVRESCALRPQSQLCVVKCRTDAAAVSAASFGFGSFDSS